MSPWANQKLELFAIDQWEASLVWLSLISVDHSLIKTRDAALLSLSGSFELHWEERTGPGEDLWSITRQLRPALNCHTCTITGQASHWSNKSSLIGQGTFQTILYGQDNCDIFIDKNQRTLTLLCWSFIFVHQLFLCWLQCLKIQIQIYKINVWLLQLIKLLKQQLSPLKSKVFTCTYCEQRATARVWKFNENSHVNKRIMVISQTWNSPVLRHALLKISILEWYLTWG